MNEAFMTTPIGDLPVNSEGMRKLADALAAAIEKQTALYDDQLRKAMALLGRVKAVHAAAIRNGDAAVSSLTSRLLYDIEKLEREIK